MNNRERNTVLFDLDGTLLPMDQDIFTKTYFKDLTARMAPCGYETDALVKAVWAGTAKMVMNQGGKSNEEVFWDAFAAIFGEKGRTDKPVFDEFYRNEFDAIKRSCGLNPEAAKLIRDLKDKGCRVILASNPIFPMVAQKKRMQWAGLDPEDFDYITSYENSSYCKPEPKYYTEILEKISAKAEDCIMVGNDVSEDMVAETLGIQTFLITDCMINKEGKDISVYRHGGYPELRDWILPMAV